VLKNQNYSKNKIMAIIKQAKNIFVKIRNEYNLTTGGKLEKVAGKVNVEATRNNLILASNKKITSDGNK
jgi:hypothetical protein